MGPGAELLSDRVFRIFSVDLEARQLLDDLLRSLGRDRFQFGAGRLYRRADPQPALLYPGVDLAERFLEARLAFTCARLLCLLRDVRRLLLGRVHSLAPFGFLFLRRFPGSSRFR